jgi:hypothetical protein
MSACVKLSLCDALATIRAESGECNTSVSSPSILYIATLSLTLVNVSLSKDGRRNRVIGCIW